MRPPNPDIALRRERLKRIQAKELRAAATDAERKLWALLRRKLAGLRFRRQQTIGPYIVEFYCPAAKLVIELDGDQHGEDKHFAYDAARTQWLAIQGYRVLRFPNRDVLRNAPSILNAIERAIGEGGF